MGWGGRWGTYVMRVDDLVGRRIGEDGLGVDTRLVGECRESGDVVVERDVDLDLLGDGIFDVLEREQIVLALDVVAVGDDHAGHQAAEGRDAVPLADAQDRGVDVGCTGLESAVGVCDGAAAVVVEVAFDVARDNAAEGADQVVDLSWAGAADGVGDTNAVYADFVDGLVEGEKVDEVGAEAVFGRESDLEAS